MFPYSKNASAPHNLEQAINPWSWWFGATASDNQNSLINITSYKSGDPQLEYRITHEIAGYGTQLNTIEKALSVVLDILPQKDMTTQQKAHISEFQDMVAGIQQKKTEHLLEEFSNGGVDGLIDRLKTLKENHPDVYKNVAEELKKAV